MKWARFSHEGRTSYGIVRDGAVEPVQGSPFASYETTGKTLGLDAVTLLPPCEPRVFYAVGYNYLGHTAEAGTFLEKAPKVPEKPDVGSRFVSALIGQDQPVIIPASSPGIIQYEGELVAVIGKPAKHVREEDALDYVLGYTIGNDISERSWQKSDRTVWRAKNTDTFKPMGPWIETDVHLPDLVTRIRVNGKQLSEFRTNDMIFGVARYIAEITQFITMSPGDMIWMGTESPSQDMRAGDVVEVEISGIGTLRNPIVAEAAA
jgi:2-keto-4-pentenoate hydratase/2-oxohepta-3-ene-1,7-dioic acid hydratase in catechol pathway